MGGFLGAGGADERIALMLRGGWAFVAILGFRGADERGTLGIGGGTAAFSESDWDVSGL